MAQKKLTAERVYRDLTETEQSKLNAARAEVEKIKCAILSEGAQRKKAREEVRRQVVQTISQLRARREVLELSLADVEAISGLKRSALSRLEKNAESANPTLLTLQRYAVAVGLTISTSVNVGSTPSNT